MYLVCDAALHFGVSGADLTDGLVIQNLRGKKGSISRTTMIRFNVGLFC